MNGAVVKGLTLAASAALAASVLAACRSPDTFVLLGQRYDAVNDCMEPTSSIDIVEGSDPGLGCAPQCVLTPSGVLYATTECGSKFPGLDQITAADGGDPMCQAAIAALSKMVVCGSGGGGGDDGGGGAADVTSEGAATDASVDAPPEATADVAPEASE